MKVSTVLYTFLFLSLNSFAQDTLTFLTGNYVGAWKRNVTVTPLYTQKGDSIFYRNKALKVKLPSALHWADTAFGFLYFTGCETAVLDRTLIFFVGNRDQSHHELLLDYNGNLNLTDDGTPIPFSDSVIVALPNSENPAWEMHYMLLWNEQSPEVNKSNWNFYSNKSTAHNNQILPVNYWLHDQRLDTRLADTIINKQHYLIALYDNNANGKFNDQGERGDRILSGDAATGFISTKGSQGAEDLSDTTLILQNGKVFRVTDVDAAGSFFSMVPSDLPYLKLLKGDRIPNFIFNDLEGNRISLYSLLDSSKYTLIDVWGQWCHGCVVQFPKLKSLYEKYHENLQVISLDFGDGSVSTKKFIEKHGGTWPNGMVTPEIIEKLSIDIYPFYNLIAPDGRIINLYISLKEVEDIMEGVN